MRSVGNRAITMLMLNREAFMQYVLDSILVYHISMLTCVTSHQKSIKLLMETAVQMRDVVTPWPCDPVTKSPSDRTSQSTASCSMGPMPCGTATEDLCTCPQSEWWSTVCHHAPLSMTLIVNERGRVTLTLHQVRFYTSESATVPRHWTRWSHWTLSIWGGHRVYHMS